MTDYQDICYEGHDGLSLYARDYPSCSGEDSPTILCMHGLTRNSADFDDICCVLSHNYRLIAVDQRGRGRSEYDPDTENYNPAIYVQDMFALLQRLSVSEVILFGTSMGGIMSMMMSSMRPEVVSAVIINDIGPEVAHEGLTRLQGYVGKAAPVADWHEAAAQTKDINGLAFPKASEQDWLDFAKRVYRVNEQGVPELAYDPCIAESIKQSEGLSQSLDLWPTFQTMLDKPLLLLRGELSDILTPECVTKMQKLKPDMQYAEIPTVGHAPLLNEPEAVTAIQQFLQSLSM